MLSSFSSLVVFASALLLQCVPTQGHQVVYVPSPTWTRANSTSTERRVLWNPLSFLEDEGFTTSENFTEWQVDNGYATLRDFMDTATYSVTDGADQACGWSDPDGIPQQIPEDSTMRTSGYTHDGPCEIWMGDTLALSGLNCHESITDMTFTIDYTGCGSSCVMYWYWLGVRYLNSAYSWQVYKECIPLYSLTASSASTTTTTTEAPATESSETDAPEAEADTTATETPATEAPATEAPATEAPATEAPATEAPATEPPTTEAPAAEATSTEAPATTEKCNARNRFRA